MRYKQHRYINEDVFHQHTGERGIIVAVAFDSDDDKFVVALELANGEIVEPYLSMISLDPPPVCGASDPKMPEVHCNDKPGHIARTRIDFSDWLASLKRRDRRVAEFLANGESTTAAAQRFKVSAGRISQLRRELAASWTRFIGGEEGPAALAV